MHEYKHILDHYNLGFTAETRSTSRFDPVEYVADYFAGCVLAPKLWLRSAYYGGIQRTSELADLFHVSVRAIEVRLAQVGITTLSDLTDRPLRYRIQRSTFMAPSPEYVPATFPIPDPHHSQKELAS